MKLLYLGLNPIQNPKPYRLLNEIKGLDYLVAYLKRPDESFTGKENLNKGAFTHDLTSSYKHKYLNNRSPFKQRSGFWAYFHPEIFTLVKQHDIVVIYGHHALTFLLALFWCRCLGKKVILTSDATYMEANDESKGWKLKIKPLVLRCLYNTCSNGVFVPSTASANFLSSIGVNANKIVVTPYVVDEDLLLEKAKQTNVLAFRTSLGLSQEDFVFIFCAKLISRKRPLDAILALSKIEDPMVKLLLIGTGPEEEKLHHAIAKYNLQGRVKLLGLVKYTELASYYASADALVFCSDHEPYGLPVNEAMLCGLPAILSDRIGAGLDLLQEGITGYTYPSGDVAALAQKMILLSSQPALAKKMGLVAQERMKQWSSQTNVDRQLEFFGLVQDKGYERG